MLLLHMAEPDAWDAARRDGVYRAASLDTEGFIHCSTPEQVVDTANRFYAGRRDLVLLCIDPAGLDLRWEEGSVPGSAPPSRARPDALGRNGGSDGQPFPHLYRPLPVLSVRCVTPIFPGADGVWRPRDFGHIPATPGAIG